MAVHIPTQLYDHARLFTAMYGYVPLRLRAVSLFLQREKRGRQPEKKKVPLPPRAFSHARGHLRVSGVLLDGPRKKRDCS